MDIALHPLVALSISEHYTRQQQQYPTQPRVLGLLFGKITGTSRYDALETVEIGYTATQDSIKIEHAALDTDVSLFLACYPDYKCLGWYSNGDNIQQPLDSALHKQVQRFGDQHRFYYLLMNVSAIIQRSTNERIDSKTFMQFYEDPSATTADSPAAIDFRPISSRYEAEEVERIVSFQMTASTNVLQNRNESSTKTTFASSLKAIQVLRRRIVFLHNYVSKVQKGEIAGNPAILRSISTIIQSLPILTLNVPAFTSSTIKPRSSADPYTLERSLDEELLDTSIISILTEFTSSLANLARVTGKYNAVIDSAPSNKIRMDDLDEYAYS